MNAPETLVVKYGGNAITDNHALDAFAEAIVALIQARKQVVIVHGGAPQINHWLEKTALKSHFVDGQRYTDPDTLTVVEMVLSGQVNKAIVRALQRQGLTSVGISGQDGLLFTADAVPHLGQVGKMKRVNPALVLALLEKGYTPVVAPLACDEEGELLNVNADFAAAHLAGRLNAAQLLLMTNVAGILDGEKQRLASVDRETVATLTEQGVIHGGMLPKTECAFTALEMGCQSVVILDGSSADNLQKWRENPEAVGTQITP